ncbi:hypothetical protein B9Z19DRAFT_1122574 [Tuber borchii]|uniref:Uncharacterized protein n=1 Tax=Tuber borchii TaxID=42251 RepID=A0A2T7A041_TUBBO|nr:hypothetical protein B9Z19DRAFT_1122574 [Tuber borchii]
MVCWGFKLQYDKREAFLAHSTDQKAAILPVRLQGGTLTQDDYWPAASLGESIVQGTEAVPESLSQDVSASGRRLMKAQVTIHSLCYLLQGLYGQPLFNVRLTLSLFRQPQNDVIFSNLGALHRIVKRSTEAAAPSGEEGVISTVVAMSAESQLQSRRSQDEPKEAEKAISHQSDPFKCHSMFARGLKNHPFLGGAPIPSMNSMISKLPTLFPSPFMIIERWKRLDSSDSVTDKYRYWIVMLSSITSLLPEGKGSGQVITITLATLKQNNGIKAESHQRMEHASYGDIKITLYLFTPLVSNKSVLDSPQTIAPQTRERSGGTPYLDFFTPYQFLVELRASILLMVKNMWAASSIEKAACSIVKSVIEILGIVLKAGTESGAFTRKGDQQHVSMGFTRENTMAGLLLGNFNASTATKRFTPQGVITPQPGSQISASSCWPLTAESHSTDKEGTNVDAAREEPIVPAHGYRTNYASHALPAPAVDTGVPAADMSVPAINIDESNIRPPTASDEPQASESAEIFPSTGERGRARECEKVEQLRVITIEGLDQFRSAICESLIDRSLDVRRVHSTVTLELSSLLTSAFGKVSESSGVRKEAVSTILQSVVSLQVDDLWPYAKTITSTFPLLGLGLQNQDFFDSCLVDLKDNILALIEFIELNKGEPAPWIAINL